MKITVDTKEDSKEEIIKLIRMLSALVDENVLVNKDVNKDLFSESSAGESSKTANSFTALFGQGSDSASTADNGEEEKPEENVELIPY